MFTINAQKPLIRNKDFFNSGRELTEVLVISLFCIKLKLRSLT